MSPKRSRMEQGWPVPAPENLDVHEMADRVLVEAILQGEKVGSGRDAVVFRLDLGGEDASKIDILKKEGLFFDDDDRSAAMKVLKVYRPGDGVKEYEIQKKAESVLKEKNNCAKIPRAIGLRDQHIDERTREYLNSQGAHLRDGMEAVVMEFIPGKDMATIMYEFVLEKKGFTKEFLEHMSFDEKNAAVASRLGFSEGRSANARSEEQGQFAEMVALNENGKKLTRFLRQNGFKIDSSIIEKVENALTVMQAAGIYHNDMHERNVMIKDDGEVFIIDFGRSMTSVNENTTDDFAVIRRWREISTSFDEELNSIQATRKKGILTNFDRMKKNPKWQERIMRLESDLISSGSVAVVSAVQLSLGNDQNFEQTIGVLLGIGLQNQELWSSIKDGLSSILKTGSLRPFEENKIKQVLEDWTS